MYVKVYMLLFFLSCQQLFTDGTTNKLVGCYTDDDPEDVVLVRVYGNKTELIVDRDNELKSFQVVSDASEHSPFVDMFKPDPHTRPLKHSSNTHILACSL